MTEAINNEMNWEELHAHLRNALQEEVRLTRELLSNMHKEELSLMFYDHGSLNQVLIEQSHLFERLSLLRAHRQMVTFKIEKIVTEKNKALSIDEMLPPTEEITTEILSLTDQLMCLTEKMNRQHGLNQHLTQHPDKKTASHFQHSTQPRSLKKASVATYNIKR